MLICPAVQAQEFSQQAELIGSGATGGASQGNSAAISAHGNTALVGGPSDNNGAGAVWVFTRDNNGNWTQQGSKLVGSGAIDPASQGSSVALSADGNTAIEGGPGDNNGTGAVWVFTRDSNGNWTQQGSKLVGSGAIGSAMQGNSVALSADGNTAIEGGPGDNNGTGAVWVFTRDSNGNWTQQGSKLAGNDAVNSPSPASQGYSVALSADGNTAIEGGTGDNDNVGAAWVFVRDSNGNWTQQGSKLVGSGAISGSTQGNSVALSANGNTALVGGPSDNGGNGAAWVFTRDSNGNWTQQGSKLMGDDADNSVSAANQGYSVALSGDGNTAIEGGIGDNGDLGAAWVFTRTGNGAWAQQGAKLVGSGSVNAGAGVFQGSSVAISSDVSTVLVGGPDDNNSTGAVWVFAGPSITESAGDFTLSQGASAQFGSFSLVMQNDGNLVLYAQNGTPVWDTGTYGQNCGTNQCAAVFQGDGNFVVYNGTTPLWSTVTYGNPGAQLVLSAQMPHLEIIGSNQSILWTSESIFSAGNLTLIQGASVQFGSFSLVMQSDGNLVLYEGSTAIWDTGTYGQNCGANQCMAVFQADGNFVVYNGTTPLWSSGTFGNPGAQLVLSAQLPHLQITSSNQSILWSTEAAFSAGNLTLSQGASLQFGTFILVMQGDGNLVLYAQGGTPVWDTGTYGQNCGANQCMAVFQPDGNFVVYNGATPLWSSGTFGNPGAELVLSNQTPQLEIVGSNQSVLWSNSGH